MSPVSSWHNSSEAFWARTLQMWHVVLSALCQEVRDADGSVTGDIDFDHLGKVVSRIFHCKVTIFPFVIDNYLVGDGLKLLISCFSYFCLLILAPTGVVQNSYYLLWCLTFLVLWFLLHLLARIRMLSINQEFVRKNFPSFPVYALICLCQYGSWVLTLFCGSQFVTSVIVPEEPFPVEPCVFWTRSHHLLAPQQNFTYFLASQGVLSSSCTLLLPPSKVSWFLYSKNGI